MHKGSVVEQIRQQLLAANDLYNRLILVVGLAESGKTASLREFAALGPYPMINTGAELSRGLVELSERQRILQLPRMLEEIVAAHEEPVLILDNTEILFTAALQQDPLRLLRQISRNRTIIASWFGSITGPELTHAVPNHPEFRRYSSPDVLFVAASPDGAGLNCEHDLQARILDVK